MIFNAQIEGVPDIMQFVTYRTLHISSYARLDPIYINEFSWVYYTTYHQMSLQASYKMTIINIDLHNKFVCEKI